MNLPRKDDEDYDSNELAQTIHRNSQATIVLLASLCRDEFNKVNGLQMAKEIWDALKTTNKGDKITKWSSSKESLEG
jgi:hypothetical protein